MRTWVLGALQNTKPRSTVSNSFLKRQIPCLHGMLLASLVAFVIAIREQPVALLAPAIVLFGILLVRGLLVPTVNAAEAGLETIRSELRKTFFIASAFFAIAAGWELTPYLATAPDNAADIAMFSGLSALGAAGALSGLPAAARIPLLSCALPAGFLLLGDDQPARNALGVTLLVVVLVRLRLSQVQDRTFAHLVHSRFQVESEQKRAVKAEQNAIKERARVEVIANSDSLTGLVNRRGLFAKLAGLPEVEVRRLAFILIDLDGFKPINDTFGHLVGTHFSAR